MTTLTLQSLCTHAISHSLFSPTTLKSAIDRLKFVQADPIRSPARAQDLILRHRVVNYRAGDLERQYPNLNLEEDVLYAYGFLTRDIRQILHPRKAVDLTEFEQNILEAVSRLGEVHPAQLEAHFGRERVVNAWGGYSKATTRALEHLHYHGFLRIARRVEGIRVYEVVPPASQQFLSKPAELNERLKKLIIIISNIFAPVTERCLQEALALIRRSLSQSVNTRTVIAGMLKSGELEKQTINGIGYLYPSGNLNIDEAPRTVRFLAPFDPLVWDRRRFEHFWGWAYRFEAYTPQAKRVRGYYAMPMLWGDWMIGWANVDVQKSVLKVGIGYTEKTPADSDFSLELDREISRLKTFLNLEK